MTRLEYLVTVEVIKYISNIREVNTNESLTRDTKKHTIEQEAAKAILWLEAMKSSTNIP